MSLTEIKNPVDALTPDELADLAAFVRERENRDIIEDELQFTPEFERAIQHSERDMAEDNVRVRRAE